MGIVPFELWLNQFQMLALIIGKVDAVGSVLREGYVPGIKPVYGVGDSYRVGGDILR